MKRQNGLAKQQKGKSKLSKANSRWGTRRQMEAYEEANALFQHGNVSAAEEILLELNDEGDFPAVIRLLANLNLEVRDYSDAFLHAERLVRLLPGDQEARFVLASSALGMGYVATCTCEFQVLLKRWPDSPFADGISAFLEKVHDGLEKAKAITIEQGGIGEIGFMAFHEKALHALTQFDTNLMIHYCNKLLSLAPNFYPARNNLCISNFHAGRISQAIEIASEAIKLSADNRLAKLLLARFKFLTGESVQTTELVDELIATPPPSSEFVILAAEFLILVGLDLELLQFMKALSKKKDCSPQHEVVFMHFEAYANAKLGNDREAKRLWEKCAKKLPSDSIAHENLQVLTHAVAGSFSGCFTEQWLPGSLTRRLEMQLDRLYGDSEGITFPSYLKDLIPVLFDRGNSELRRVAVAYCVSEGTKELVEMALKFATSNTGLESERYQTLVLLCQRGLIKRGSYPFYKSGRLSEVRLPHWEVFWEGIDGGLPKELNYLLGESYQLLNAGNLDAAETLLKQVLSEAPDDNTARFNLAMVWLRRGGIGVNGKAFAVIKEINQQHPNYVFAAVALASESRRHRDFEQANALLEPMFLRDKLQVTEYIAVMVEYAQIARAKGNKGEALAILDVLDKIAGESPQATSLRKQLEAVKGSLSRFS